MLKVEAVYRGDTFDAKIVIKVVKKKRKLRFDCRCDDLAVGSQQQSADFGRFVDVLRLMMNIC